MNKIKVTQKVILALIYNKEIVNMKWLESFDNCDYKNFEVPINSNFFPSISENDIFEKLTPDVFKPNKKRRELFKNITFIIFSISQYNKLASIIEAANGSIVSLNEKMKNNEIKNISDLIGIIKQYKNTCMVEPSGDINSEQKQLIIDTAQFLNQRLIDDSEIGFSVIYSSTDVFTNKDISVVNNQAVKIKETQYLPTLANNSLIFNPQSTINSKSYFFTENTVNKLNSNNNQSNEESTDISKVSNDNETSKENLDSNTNKSDSNVLFDDKSFLESMKPLNSNDNKNNEIKSNDESELSISDKFISKKEINKREIEIMPEDQEHSMKSVKSQNLSLFWDNLIDIASGDESASDNYNNNNNNRKENTKNNIFNKNAKSEILKKDTIKFNDNTKQSNELEISKNNIKMSNKNFGSENPKNDITINIDEDISVSNINKINNNIINTNSQDNIIFNSLNFVTNDEVSKQSNSLNENKLDKSSFNNINILKKTQNVISNNISLIEDNLSNYEVNEPLFYKYDLIVNNVNQEFYDEGRIINNNNEEEEKTKVDKNEKRNYSTAFDNNDSENEEENNEKLIKDDQNDYYLIDELKIEAVVSFSDNLISSRKPKSTSYPIQFNGVNFKRFKKSKFIKNNDIIDRNSLFYYEDNKISEEWLLDNDNETKEKKNLTSEAILVKTNTLLNPHTLKDANIDSMFNSISSSNNNIVNNSIFIEDDNSHIHLTNNEIKKRKTTKRIPSKKQVKNEIIISDSDDDEKFVWN